MKKWRGTGRDFEGIGPHVMEVFEETEESLKVLNYESLSQLRFDMTPSRMQNTPIRYNNAPVYVWHFLNGKP
jgi:hypothetical protein